MSRTKLLNHRLKNLFHTVILIVSMAALLAVLGYALAGVSGLIWAGALGLLFLSLGREASPQLFFRLTRARPLAVQEAPGLYRSLKELAARARLPAVPALYYIPNQAANAVTVGRRANAAIGLTDGLLRRLNNRELTAVLAHEISHVSQGDLKVMTLAGAINRMTTFLAWTGQILLFINLPLLLMGRSPFSWFALLALLAAPTLSGLLQLALSRTREYEADLGAVRLTGDPEGLASALYKMENRQAGLLDRFFGPRTRPPDSNLLRTHPNTNERIRRLLELKDDHHPAAQAGEERPASVPGERWTVRHPSHWLPLNS